MMKLGLFLFLQLKDGTLTSGMPVPWSTSQALCVWPLRTRRGRSHQRSCGPGGSNGQLVLGWSPAGAHNQSVIDFIKLNMKSLLHRTALFCPYKPLICLESIKSNFRLLDLFFSSQILYF